MLTQDEKNAVWRDMLEAEVRSYYFGELASKYSQRKQIIAFVTFFLSSGAAATLFSSVPSYVPMSLALLTAGLTSYSIAVGLDRKALTMSKLHSQWMQISSGYERLWNRWSEEDAHEQISELMVRSHQASETGTTEAPYIPELLDKWADHVYSRYRQATT